jgi:hypothetical protein
MSSITFRAAQAATVFLLAVGMDATLSAQTQTIVRSVPFVLPGPIFQCSVSCSGVPFVTAGAITVPQFSGPSQLIGIDLVLDGGLSAFYSGQLSLPGTYPVPGSVTATYRVLGPCLPLVTTSIMRSGTGFSTGSPNITFPLPSGSASSGVITLPVSCLPLFRGVGSVSLQMSLTLLQSVRPQIGVATGRFTYSSLTTGTLRVVYRFAPESYGAGCPGANGVPQLAAQGLPQLGNANFALTLANAYPSSAAAVIMAPLRGSAPIGGGCVLLLDPSFVIAGVALTNGSGSGVFPYPIPVTSSLEGFALRSQMGVLDPGGAFQSLLALTNGLEIRLGL